MLKVWRKKGVDKVLKKAGEKGIALSGLSAGAICWFNYGNSDSLRFTASGNETIIKLKGLGFVKTLVCPHYDVEKNRRPSLRKMIEKKGGVALALENCAALQVVGDKCRILTSSKSANAYIVFRKDGKVVEERVDKINEFRPLNEILRAKRQRRYTSDG